MSLYDDLDNSPISKDSKSDVSGWSSGFKLLQSQLQAKKASLLQTKRQRQNTLAPVVDLKRNSSDELHFNQLTGKLERVSESAVSPSIAPPFISIEPHSRFAGVDDEYNPSYPNEYDEFVKKRREQRQRERDNDRRNRGADRGGDDDRDRSGGRRQSGGHGGRNNTNNRNSQSQRRGRDNNRRRDDDDNESEFEKRRRMREDDDADYEKPRRPVGGGAAIAPPKSLMEDDDDDVGSDSGNDMNAVPPPYSDEKKPPAGMSMGLAGSVASKIMAKYGYKEGQGLGKKEQGMSTALMVEKTSKRGGKIIHEKDIAKYTFEDPFKIPTMDPTAAMPRASVATTDLLRNPSKVILLRNMVGPGEVDDDLEPETADECTKYGKVIKCVIFEMPDVEEDEAVRIFVEFERQESAIKAVVDLNGRYFGGRIVKAGFFNIDKFRRLDLGGDL
ncbi:splicing factor 45-like [Tubulanus polymorphus]|uniref:splicing factor 45-like n=1 Tax=Tubulanus polymorphus TaxID=672921 RepID=UPI003DA31147